MSSASTAGATAAAAYSILANAVKASGAIINVSPASFSIILNRAEKPLVIYTQGGFLAAKHQYLTSYKGLVFFTKDNQLLNLPSNAEIIQAKKIWIPS
jgi:hypothetical protein